MLSKYHLLFGIIRDFNEMVRKAVDAAALEEVAGPGDTVVITAGVPFGTPDATNVLRIVRSEPV